MRFRQALTLYLLINIALCSTSFAQLVDIPDPNLRHAIGEALNLPAGAPITQEDMRRLTHLTAPNSGITDLLGLETATNLEYLYLTENLLGNLSPLADLPNLKALILRECQIRDIRTLSRLTQLEILLIHDNQIHDISALANLTRLIELNARNNPISDLSALTHLTALEYLDLSRCLIVDISPLSHLVNLKVLQLNHNQIVDVRPISTLTSLYKLEIDHNLITDHSPLDSLTLETFYYDQTCEMPPLPLEPRLANRTYPSVLGPQWLFGHDSRADLMFGGTYLGMGWRRDGKLVGILEHAIQKRDELIAMNPNMVFLVEIRIITQAISLYGEDAPYWIRDANGNLVFDDPGRGIGLLDFTHPATQDLIVEHAVSVSKCGLFDGILFDSWLEDGVVLHDSGIPYRGLDAEQRARDNILRRIRAETRPNFLIQVNSNRKKLPRTGPYINGLSMETGIPAWFPTEDELKRALLTTESTLLWAESNLREPHINGVVGEALFPEAADSPENQRWARVVTTLSLTHADGYALYQALSERDWGAWYDFLDVELGHPVGGKAQLYRDRSGLFIREFTKGWAVYNRSGETQEITLPESVTGVASEVEGTTHTLPNYDGEIYLRVNRADVYAEPINAVPGATLLLDASNNPGTTVHWVNLGTVGGRLGSSDRHDGRLRVEEGEIEIPSIGFSGRRKYYTATASGQTFGGPVQANPKLYLGDWTLEFLCKRNGNLFDLEHHFAGFQNSPREELQGIRLWLPNDGQELSMSIHANGFKQPERALNIFLEENVWTWVTIVSLNGESIIAYQDGVKVSHHPGVQFDANFPLDDISIGSFSYDERDHNFNGSFSIVRVYDTALSQDEVLQNIGAVVIPITNPADVNGDGVVNILDLVAVAQAFGKDDLQGDVNGDGVVNVFDLVQVAGAIGGGGAAPSANSLDPSIISAADVERWLALAQGINIGDANFQRGIRFLEGLLAALTPKETTLLPNYPNPFNPETWIPYRLAREAEVMITIYDTKGTLVRRLALGNQAAGYYAEREKAAYWDGRNEDGEAVASGIYIYQFRAGDYAASRRMVIVK